MSSHDFVLLADLNQRLRTGGWQRGFTNGSWVRGDVHICWDAPESTLEILDCTDEINRHTAVYVESVQQAIDVLVALDWLPASMRTKWPTDEVTLNGEKMPADNAVSTITAIARGIVVNATLPRNPCPDCCGEDEDPLSWCRCTRGRECAGRCRQRAHDPGTHAMAASA